jgi:hypothetical protein
VLSAIETGPKPRKFLGGIKVRGVLYDIYCIAQETDVTGALLYCAKGYFKELFESQYGRKTGHRFHSVPYGWLLFKVLSCGAAITELGRIDEN